MSGLPLIAGVRGNAAISHDQQYRYWLSRDWHGERSLGCVAWIMLNPSIGNAWEDDRTLRRCQSFAQSWGYGAIVVVNLFGYRSPHPEDLRTVADPVGPDNDVMMTSVLQAATTTLVVAAWGTGGRLRNRDATVIALAGRFGITLHALELTAKGAPRHPLYVPGETQPIVYRSPVVPGA